MKPKKEAYHPMKENKKYKLREDDAIVREGRKLYRIQALRDVRYSVKEGKVGGYVESEANLSHEGTCWLFENACAYEDARVEGEARMHGHATLRGKAKLSGDATLWDHAIVQGEAKVGGGSQLNNQVVVGGSAILKGNVLLYDDVHVGDEAYLEGDDPKRELVIQGTTMILGSTIMQGYGVFPEEEAILEAGSFLFEGDE